MARCVAGVAQDPAVERLPDPFEPGRVVGEVGERHRGLSWVGWSRRGIGGPQPNPMPRERRGIPRKGVEPDLPIVVYFMSPPSTRLDRNRRLGKMLCLQRTPDPLGLFSCCTPKLFKLS